MPDPLAIAPSPSAAASSPILSAGPATIPAEGGMEAGEGADAANFASLLLAKMAAALPGTQNPIVAADIVSSAPRDDAAETGTGTGTDIIAMLAPLLPGIVPTTSPTKSEPAVDTDALADITAADPSVGLDSDAPATAVASVPADVANPIPIAAPFMSPANVTTPLPRTESGADGPPEQAIAQSRTTTDFVAASDAQSPANIAPAPDAAPRASAIEPNIEVTKPSFEAALKEAGAAPVQADNTTVAPPLMHGVAHAKPAEIATTRTTNEITVPMGQAGWDNAIGEKISWMVGRQENRAELVLNPPQLGRIEVSLSMNGEQTNALFVSANPAVREALENAVPRLREILQEAGISLGQTQVGAESFRQAANQGENNDNRHQRHGAQPSNERSDTGFVAGTPAQWVRSGVGLVDTFA